jgi:hypothetical protein
MAGKHRKAQRRRQVEADDRAVGVAQRRLDRDVPGLPALDG